MFLKRFDRYVLSEIVTPFQLGVVVYSFTMLVNTFFILSDLLISKGAPPLTIVRMFIFILPTILSLTIPMSTLMGILAGLSRMSSDSEVLALRTFGVHHHRLYKPVLLFSFLTWVVSSLFSLYIAPEAQYHFTRLNSQVALSRAINQVKPLSFYTELPSYVLFFEDLAPKSKEWKHVLLYSNKDPENDVVILAESGFFTYTSENRRSGFITLNQVTIHRFNRLKPNESYELSHYATLRENIEETFNLSVQRRANHLPIHQVWAQLSQNRGDVRLAIEFHNRFAFPFAALVLGFLGVSLGISTQRGGRASGFVISLALIFVYYALQTLGRNLALSKHITPGLGIWGANLFLLAVGLMAFRVTSRGATLRFKRVFRWLKRIRGWGARAMHPSEKPVVLVRFYPARRHALKLLDGYILMRLLFMFLLIFLSLMAIMYISKILELIDNIFNNNLPFSIVLVYLYHHSPELVSITLPISVLTAVLLTFSLMSKQNEIITIQISGVSIHRILLPALAFGLSVSLLFFALQEKVLPESSRKAKEILNTIYGSNRSGNSVSDMHRNWAIDRDKRIFFYSHYDEERQQFIRFNVIELDENFAMKSRLSADSAQWQDPVTLTLHKGTERVFLGDLPVQNRSFMEKPVVVPEGDRFFKTVNVSETETENMNISQLSRYVDYLESNQSDSTRFQAKIYQKMFYPFSSLVMVLIATPFAFLMGKRGSMHGIGAAVVISMVFLGMIGFLNSFGNNGLMPPLLAGVSPYLIFMGASIVLILKIRT